MIERKGTPLTESPKAASDLTHRAALTHLAQHGPTRDVHKGGWTTNLDGLVAAFQKTAA